MTDLPSWLMDMLPSGVTDWLSEGSTSPAHTPKVPPKPDTQMDSIMRWQEFQESRGDPTAVSPAGAVGLMQVMPKTARDAGDGIRILQDREDPYESRRFAEDYMASLLKRYDGDTDTALAAYNWGMGNMDKHLAGKKVMPKETRDYVASYNKPNKEYKKFKSYFDTHEPYSDEVVSRKRGERFLNDLINQRRK